MTAGVVVMDYGTPADEAAVEPYFTHIRGGRRPSEEALAELTGRYRAIGFSPLQRITAAQAAALERACGLPVLVGHKHAPPFIEDAAREATRRGLDTLVGLPLAPHFSAMSVGAYEHALREAWPGELRFVPGFHDHPAFIGALAAVLREALTGYAPDRLFFTAHSLPARILAAGDPYRDQLLRTCELVAGSMPLPPWEFAFQSASATGEPWLGPDLLEALDAAAADGCRSFLVCPVGFVAEHLEILYDLDVEAQAHCRERGLELRRTRMFNDDPAFIACLAAVVEEALATA